MSAQFSLKKKVRPSRPSHNKTGELHDDGHAWAVSYADFLMVLLSFFILFFSMEKNQRNNFIQNLMDTNEKLSKESKASTATTIVATTTNQDIKKEGTPIEAGMLPAGLASLTSKLKNYHIDQTKSEKIVIYFEDNIYKPGAIKLPPKQLDKLQDLLDQLDPFMDHLKITFVGHTDGNKRFKHKSLYMKNNFDLSSLRATNALQQVVKMGYSPKNMFIQGVAEHDRASRTISIIISPGDKNNEK